MRCVHQAPSLFRGLVQEHSLVRNKAEGSIQPSDALRAVSNPISTHRATQALNGVLLWKWQLVNACQLL